MGYCCSVAFPVAGSVTCNHDRAHDFFYHSIISDCTFKSVPCASHDDADAVRTQYRHLIPAPFDRMSESAWLYKHS